MAILYKIGEEDTRPWGHWQVLDAGENYVVKRIRVLADARLSLQYHHHREETWTCVEGEGVATIDGKDIPLKPGSTVFVPKLAHHRMSGAGSNGMTIIEIQMGETLDENDIVRIEDDFGRTS